MFRKFVGLVLTIWLAGSAMAETKAIPFDRGRFPALRQMVERDAGFPNLRGEFEVLDQATGKSYNCIAWSIGNKSQWVWPGTAVADFDRLYAKHGFRRLKTMDTRMVAGMQKIVLFAKSNAGRLEATHAARQLADGTWSSKLGQLPLIRHRGPDAVSGPSYGRPVAVYVRQ